LDEKEVEIFRDTLNCEAGVDLETGDFVERVFRESGEPAGWDITISFRDNGAINKGDRDVVDRRGAVTGCLQVCRF